MAQKLGITMNNNNRHTIEIARPTTSQAIAAPEASHKKTKSLSVDDNEATAAAAAGVSELINDRRAELIKFDLATAKERAECKIFPLTNILQLYFNKWVRKKTRYSFRLTNDSSPLRTSQSRWTSRISS